MWDITRIKQSVSVTTGFVPVLTSVEPALPVFRFGRSHALLDFVSKLWMVGIAAEIRWYIGWNTTASSGRSALDFVCNTLLWHSDCQSIFLRAAVINWVASQNPAAHAIVIVSFARKAQRSLQPVAITLADHVNLPGFQANGQTFMQMLHSVLQLYLLRLVGVFFAPALSVCLFYFSSNG